jgi:hypothetical protein
METMLVNSGEDAAVELLHSPRSDKDHTEKHQEKKFGNLFRMNRFYANFLVL